MSIITPINSRIILEPVNCDYRKAFDLSKKQKLNQELYLPVTHLALSVCKTLFLNNYEVNTIISSYLCVWNKHPEKCSILKADLELYFEPENRGFIRYFFTDKVVSCNEFVLFACFFLFYNTDDILSVLLSMYGVVSNLIITKEQANRFIYYFGYKETQFAELMLNLDSVSDVYDLKVFTNFVRNSNQYLSCIHNLKKDIKTCIFDNETYKNIITRKNYYNFVINIMSVANSTFTLSDAILKPPNKENCFKKCNRVLFRNKPSPYHYDFCIDTIPNKARINVLYQIKKRFGYSKRSSSTCFTSFSNFQKNNNGDKDKPHYLKSVGYISLGHSLNKMVPYPYALVK